MNQLKRNPVHAQLDVTLLCHDTAEISLPGNLKLPDTLKLIFNLEEESARLVSNHSDPVNRRIYEMRLRVDRELV